MDGALKMYPPVYDYANVMLSNSQGNIIYVLNRHGALKDMDHILPESWQEAFKEGKKEVYLSDVFRSRRQWRIASTQYPVPNTRHPKSST